MPPKEWKSPLGLPSNVPEHTNAGDAPNLSNDEEKVTVYMMPEDARDKVLSAIVKALLKTGNVPATPKELCVLIQKGNLANLGYVLWIQADGDRGNTPHATVSSRISQLYKRCSETKRMPILGKWSVDGDRRLRYYIDQPPIPWNPVPEKRLSLNKNVTPESMPDLSPLHVNVRL
jgi:hypothetical protein